MGCKVTILYFCLVFATVRAIEVHITRAWKPNIGLEINCSWAITPDESLLSVGLYKDKEQLIYYRPEVDGISTHRVSRHVENMTSTNCAVQTDDQQKGTCVITLELYKPLWRDFMIFCDVTGGERPFLGIKRKKFFVDGFVPPSDAVITVGPVNEESGPVTLNCSTSCFPRPAYLSWTISDKQKPREFTGESWNATSKLWHAWSVISYTPSKGSAAVCTPEIGGVGEIVKGHAAQYNETRNLKATVQAIEVNITNAWKPYIGWEINCSWVIPPDDSLQAVLLYRDNQQLMFYRPEVDGSSSHRVSRRVENITSTNCAVSTDDQQKGTCVITLELYKPLWRDFMIFCDVTGGERPFLGIKRKKFFVDGFVPPSDAVITVGPVNEESGPVTLNCSTSCFPRPAYLSWTISDKQKPREFTGESWNATSKLWHAWSVISYTPSKGSAAVCTPEIGGVGEIVKGHAAQYNETRNLKATVQAIEVNITNAWKPYIGWEINCSWVIPPDDSLQAVLLYRDNQQLMFYRPEVDGSSSHRVSRRVENITSTNCAVSTDDQQKGTCVITLELYKPLWRDFTIFCDVTGGERPFLSTKRKNFFVDGFVPPSDAVITDGPVNEESGPVTLNCSTSHPRPAYLSWTIGDQQKPREFTGKSWNATSKLWHAWSVISYAPSRGSPAVCTPEINRGGKLLVKGHAAQYNEARNLKATDRPIEVNITNAWKPYIGWEVNCSWAIPPGDSLQSVRLYKDYEQFMIYRPEADGGSSHNVSSREHMMSTNCAMSTEDRQKGTCLITLELYRPLQLPFTISCEVSSEKPNFRMDWKNFIVNGFGIPPSDAVITVGPVNEESGQVTLNCSASCVSIPHLSWTIGDQRKPREFPGISWNATSKLWHAWSVISYTPSSGNAAVCTPEISRGSEVLAKGHAAQYNAARNLKANVPAIEVNITNAWKPYIGWEINCSWAIPPDDSLLSVRLYRDHRQFMIYRPEVDGGSSHTESRDIEEMMSTNCAVPTVDRQKGTCVITLDLYGLPLAFPFTLTCEVSGERPYFRKESKKFLVGGIVPPSDAVITVGPVNETTGQVTLNCSASCIPTIPDLSWTIGDQKIPREFSSGYWNATSKLWHAWSVISYMPSSGSAAVCTPEISRGSEVLAKGHAAQYNAARNLKATVRPIEVNITNAWKPYIGWEINCSWAIPPDDSLLSVGLYRDNQQLMYYRPEVDGSSSHTYTRYEEEMTSINCAVPTDDQQKGTCVITLELYGLPLAFPFTLTCEVSSERPYFRKESKKFLVGGIVPPSDAVITVGPVNETTGQVTLNCSASCIPTIPDLSWTIGDQKIPHEISDAHWNATSKLWHVWSVISYTPSSGSPAVCTPEISRGSEVLAKGHAAQYNAARNLQGGVLNTIITVLNIPVTTHNYDQNWST